MSGPLAFTLTGHDRALIVEALRMTGEVLADEIAATVESIPNAKLTDLWDDQLAALRRKLEQTVALSERIGDHLDPAYLQAVELGEDPLA